jgi:hypothetical protein
LASIPAIAPAIGYDAKTTATCPDSTLKETKQDCPWAGIARELTQRATQKTLTVDDFRALAPQIAAQLKADSSKTDLKALWGESINYDELAHGVILDPAILKAMAEIFKTPYINDRTAHAGMEHTYGYLFSTLLTAYGYKRARWVQGEVEAGFGLPQGVLSPFAPRTKGTLFENVSFFAGNIAFRGEHDNLKILHRHRFNVSKAIRDFHFFPLKVTRLEETIAEGTGNPKVVLRTDLVPFTHPNTATPTGDQYLLVYSVVVSGSAKLITAFPVNQSMFDSVVIAANLGDAKPIITRYNGFIDGVSGKSFIGSRKVTDDAVWDHNQDPTSYKDQSQDQK